MSGGSATALDRPSRLRKTVRIHLELDTAELSMADLTAALEEAIERVKDRMPGLVKAGRVLAIRQMRSRR